MAKKSLADAATKPADVAKSASAHGAGESATSAPRAGSSAAPLTGSKRKRPADLDSAPEIAAALGSRAPAAVSAAASSSSGSGASSKDASLALKSSSIDKDAAPAATVDDDAASIGSKGSKSTKTAASGGVRGVSKSHRTWKAVEKKRFSSITRPGAVAAPGKGKQSVAFKVQKAHRAARLAGKAISDRLTEAAAAAKKERGERIAENRKRRAENEFKSAVVQELSDPTKLKKMSKKQLRHIKRVRINDEGVRELVPAYA